MPSGPRMLDRAMSADPDHDALEALRVYAAGRAGTRETIARARMRDYGDLIIAMAKAGLEFPKPTASPAHDAEVARASEILQPRLRHGG